MTPEPLKVSQAAPTSKEIPMTIDSDEARAREVLAAEWRKTEPLRADFGAHPWPIAIRAMIAFATPEPACEEVRWEESSLGRALCDRRAIAAGDFKDPQHQGQRGEDWDNGFIAACRIAEQHRLARLTASSAVGGAPYRYRHKARGTEYDLIGAAELQDARGAGVPEGVLLAIYRGDDGKLWARRHTEFSDGRFELLPTPPKAMETGR